MRKFGFVAAAALALPLQSPSFAQVPAPVDLETIRPVSGSWSYHSVAGGSWAAFVDGRADQKLILRCNRAARTVSIVRTGVPAAAPTLTIWTTTSDRSVPSRFDATRTLSADLAAMDPLLDAIAFSRGRFATAARGAALLAVPVEPEPVRVIEDCRS
ncbi:MAG TPA: hypothetical protein VFP53_05770 [Sphingomicrobium sp.]|nr:hypothetical protein [Sphingomicrobium sp.]